MQQQTKNTILFVVLMLLCFGVWYALRTLVFPPPPVPPDETNPTQERVDIEPTPELVAKAVVSGDDWLGAGLAWAALHPDKASPEPKPAPKAPPPPVVQARPPTPIKDLIDKLKTTLGDKDRNSKFHLYVVLDPRGGSVRLVVLNKFQQADAMGRPVNQADGSPKPEELVPDDPDNPSYLLLHFSPADKDDVTPFDTLGKVDWTVDADHPLETLPDGRVRQSVSFTSPPVQGFQITKTFSLTEREYHLGLEVKVKRLATATVDDKPLAFRYQLTGAHGLPIEGRWYTTTFRNALIGQVEENKPSYSRGVVRDRQDLTQIANWEGGKAPDHPSGYLIRYAGVAVQYFASVLVVDNDQADQSFLTHARPTLEKTVVKGVVKPKSVVWNDDPKADCTFVLVRDDNQPEETFRIRQEDKAKLKDALVEGAPVAVVYTSGDYDDAAKKCLEYARELLDKSETQPLWVDDVTVRVATAPVEMKPGDEFTHKYLLYNGPVKVMLLEQADTAAEAVAPGLVKRYTDDLNLNTLTDYQSNGIGAVTGPTGISWMLIQITNVMHWVLWFLHTYLYFPYILCIICLTILVRGAMFPVSRKQAMTSLRMQQLAPEMRKMQEKFKDDKQALAAAQMELYRKHGVNPFGTCWLLLLQMPIFMGLYYSLQESIHFRLAGVTSWWMPNLAAPDMLLWWGESIPIISQPAWYAWILPVYLGPYLNVLPILAVSLMLVQQKWTMPPPTDEQQEQQQKMMKWMMVVMGVMFYKVASGLCIYFIASSTWGFMERQFLPKKKPGAPDAAPPADDKPREGLLARLLGPKAGDAAVTTAPATGVSGKPESALSRMFKAESESRGKGKRGKRRPDKPRGKDDGEGSMFQRLRDWWEDILDQARKK